MKKDGQLKNTFPTNGYLYLKKRCTKWVYAPLAVISLGNISCVGAILILIKPCSYNFAKLETVGKI